MKKCFGLNLNLEPLSYFLKMMITKGDRNYR